MDLVEQTSFSTLIRSFQHYRFKLVLCEEPKLLRSVQDGRQAGASVLQATQVFVSHAPLQPILRAYLMVLRKDALLPGSLSFAVVTAPLLTYKVAY